MVQAKYACSVCGEIFSIYQNAVTHEYDCRTEHNWHHGRKCECNWCFTHRKDAEKMGIKPRDNSGED
jgi:hypothetical protein